MLAFLTVENMQKSSVIIRSWVQAFSGQTRLYNWYLLLLR